MTENARKEALKKLTRVSLDNAHGHGLVIKIVPKMVISTLIDISKKEGWSLSNQAITHYKNYHARSDAAKKRVDQVRTLYQQWIKPIIDAPSMCAQPVSAGYLRSLLKPDAVNKPWRKDLSLALAFTLGPERQDAQRRRWHPTAMAAWATHDTETLNPSDEYPGMHAQCAGHGAPATFKSLDEDVDVDLRLRNRQADTDINLSLDAGMVAEIDIICAARANTTKFHKTTGAGRALVAYALSQIAAKRRKSKYQYNRVIMSAAVAANQGQADAAVGGLAQTLGFNYATSFWECPEHINNAAPTPRYYFVLENQGNTDWAETLATRIQIDPSPCPDQTGTSKGTYCR